MKFIRHSNATAFRQRVDNFLMENEAMHNVILGITSRLIHQGEQYDDVFVAHVENDAGEVVAATMRTVPANIVLSEIADKDALSLFVDAYADVYDTVPGVLGSQEDCLQFATLWQEKAGQAFAIKMEQGIYKLETLTPPDNVSGTSRSATQDDFDLLVDWMLAFGNDTGLGDNYRREDAIQNIERKLEKPILGGIRIWMDNDEPVSMAAATRELPSGGVVSFVYTPPEFRRKGYASAITADVSQVILNQGKKYCYLYTDLANPTSNKIYQAIGYQFVGNHRLIEFEKNN